MLVRPVLLLLMSMVRSHALHLSHDRSHLLLWSDTLPALFLSRVPVFPMFNPSSSATLKMCRRTSPCPLPAHGDTARGNWHEKGAEHTPHPGSHPSLWGGAPSTNRLSGEGTLEHLGVARNAPHSRKARKQASPVSTRNASVQHSYGQAGVGRCARKSSPAPRA